VVSLVLIIIPPLILIVEDIMVVGGITANHSLVRAARITMVIIVVIGNKIVARMDNIGELAAI
jgi:hypothetical protein